MDVGIVTGGQSGPIAAGFLGHKSAVHKSGVYQSVKEREASLLARPYATPYTYSAWTGATADAGADEGAPLGRAWVSSSPSTAPTSSSSNAASSSPRVRGVPAAKKKCTHCDNIPSRVFSDRIAPLSS